MQPIEFTPAGSIGLDFGTTNSAAAMVAATQPVLATFPSVAGDTHTFPSILYFDRRREGTVTRLTSAAGPQALEHYLAAEEKGRLIQSLKAYLADRRFDGTAVFSQRYSLEDMIALIARHLLTDARGLPAPLIPARVVVGRPVHFSNAQDHADDEFALGRLRGAIQQCGFTEIVFEYEPVAAAYSYEQQLDRDELILIGDFGGGTSDFSILRVGPTERRRGRTTEDIIGTDGVAVAGDAFDKQIIRKLVAPRLGLGSEYFSPPNKFLPIPAWPYERLERWHHLSFLNTAKNLEMLEHLRRSALIPERLEAFVHLIKQEMGFRLHEAVRRTKFELSTETEALFEFRCEPVSITKKVTRLDFEKWIDAEVQLMAGCVDRLLNATGVSVRDIDHVFLTGGSSFVPAVRNIFVERFGAQKITGGAELTSVATGLSLCAARQWPD
ncbi:MAG: Hsp70 family protein [Acidobacteria bacterium]|nr:MAG: Hsp70 family protein [Acidobacteriota bacterium]